MAEALQLTCSGQSGAWLLAHAPSLLSSLLRLSDEGPPLALELLTSVLTTCHCPAPPPSAGEELLHRLALSLSNCSVGVREGARTALEHLARVRGVGVGQLLLSQREALRAALLTRRLRALPVLTQVKWKGGCEYVTARGEEGEEM